MAKHSIPRETAIRMSLTPEQELRRSNRQIGGNVERRHSIAVSDGGNMRTRGEISDKQEHLIRGALLIIRCQEDRILSTALEYLISLMNSRENYTNILANLFEEELKADCDAISASLSMKLKRLAKLRAVIESTDIDDLDRQHLIEADYLPLRRETEESFSSHITRLHGKYPCYWQIREIRHQKVIPFRNGTVDVHKTIRDGIFRDLAENFKHQLTELQPYAQNFVETKSKRKKLKEVLLSLSDYDYFYIQHQGTTPGLRTYLGAFSGCVDTVLGEVYRRGPSQYKLTPQKWVQVQLTYNLGELFASLSLAEEFAKRITVLYRGPMGGSTPDHRASQATSSCTPPVEAELFDPMTYLTYATNSIKEIVAGLNIDLSITQEGSGIDAYIDIIKSYKKSCESIYEAISIVVPLLMPPEPEKPEEVVKSPLKGGSLVSPSRKDSLGPGGSPGRGGSLVSPAPGSSRRRKITLPSPSPSNVEERTLPEIYKKFSVIAANIKGQIVALDQILS